MKKILLAFQFLTIIPLKTNMSPDEVEISKSSSAFVIVGFIQGILLILTEYLSGMVFHPDLVTGIILLVLVLSNGGFHLDGLADTFDAIAARGDREKRLGVMKNSTIGTTGVIAIVFSLGIKYLSLKSLSHFLPFTYYSSLLLMPVVSKWAMVIAMFHGKPAREDGIGRLFIGRVSFKEVTISTLMFFCLPILLGVFFGRYMSEGNYAFYAILVVIVYILCRLWVKFFEEKFGGLTGDTLGAISEITEMTFLLMVLIWSQLFI